MLAEVKEDNVIRRAVYMCTLHQYLLRDVLKDSVQGEKK